MVEISNIDNAIDLATGFNPNHTTTEVLLGLILKELTDKKILVK